MSFGAFHGDVLTKWLRHGGDDRDMELLEDFSFVDPGGHVWEAPRGSVINGASIPEALWSMVGPPYVGDYRRASVVHDVACVVRDQSWEAVHRMFYDAMRADGVGWRKANVMYQAVKRFGPRWSLDDAALMSAGPASDETIRQFAGAVDEAARQTDESEGLDAVERRADEILLERNLAGEDTIEGIA